MLAIILHLRIQTPDLQQKILTSSKKDSFKRESILSTEEGRDPLPLEEQRDTLLVKCEDHGCRGKDRLAFWSKMILLLLRKEQILLPKWFSFREW